MRALLLLALLSGCGVVQLRPADHYAWSLTREPMEFYRWEVVGENFAHYCGFSAMRSESAACVVTIREAVLQPGDRNIATGVARVDRGQGRLCIVFASIDEDRANLITDKSGQMTLAAHEVGGHCRGYTHWPQF